MSADQPLYQWSKQPPTEPGFYWLRTGPEGGVPVEVYQGMFHVTWIREGLHGLVKDTKGEWAGPIPRPSEPNP